MKLLWVFIATLLILFSSTVFASETGFPWYVGQKLNSEWTVSEITLHNEYIRLSVSTGAKLLHIEITSKTKKQNEWSTEHYLIQPAPGSEFNETVFKIIKSQLLEIENNADYSLGIDDESSRNELLSGKHNSSCFSKYYADFTKLLSAWRHNIVLVAVELFIGIVIISFLVLIIFAFAINYAVEKICLLILPDKMGDLVKKTVFQISAWSIVLIPLIVLLIIIYDGWQISHNSNFEKEEDVLSVFQYYLETKYGSEFRLQLKDDVLIWPEEGWGSMPNQSIRREDVKGQKFLVYAYGGSSLYPIEQNKTLVDFIEERLQKEVEKHSRVINFSYLGYSSFSIMKRYYKSVDVLKPDMILIYSGHNDYASAYEAFKRVLYSDLLQYRTVRFLQKLFAESVKLIDNDNYRIKQYREPRRVILEFIFNSGLLRMEASWFRKADKLIFSSFRWNFEEIFEDARKRNIKVVMVTPVGNMLVAPVGSDSQAIKYYEKAESTKDKKEKQRLYKLARDMDVVSVAMRVKSEVLEYLRNINEDGVLVFDLEKKLYEDNFDFAGAYNNKRDGVHFNEVTQKLYADYIYEFMLKEGLLNLNADSQTAD